MCEHAQLEKTTQKQRQEDPIRANLQRLQTWNSAEDPQVQVDRETYRETLIRRQQELNETMQADARQQLPQAVANGAAPGTPVQEQAPAKLTYKQRREQKRKLKEARRNVNGGTVESYEMHRVSNDMIRMKENSTGPYEYRVLGRRELRDAISFCHGYRKNLLGRPATAEDRAWMERDKAYIEDYLSRDIERRKPYLEDFKQKIMAYEVTGDTFSNANIVQNFDELRRITEYSCSYENLMNDPDNAPYFDQMLAEEKAVLERKMVLLNALGGYLTSKAMACGVTIDDGKYVREIPPEMPLVVEGSLAVLKDSHESLMEDCQTLVEPVVARMADEVREQALAPLREETGERRVSAGSDIRFSQESFESLQEQMRGLRDLILSESESYAVHARKDLIDALYQDAYRTLDLQNELALKAESYQKTFDGLSSSGGFYGQTLKHTAARKASQYLTQARECEKHAADISQALSYLLKGGRVSEEVRKLIDRMETETRRTAQDGGDATGDQPEA